MSESGLVFVVMEHFVDSAAEPLGMVMPAM